MNQENQMLTSDDLTDGQRAFLATATAPDQHHTVSVTGRITDVEYLAPSETAPAGAAVRVRVTITDPATGRAACDDWYPPLSADEQAEFDAAQEAQRLAAQEAAAREAAENETRRKAADADRFQEAVAAEVDRRLAERGIG